MKQYFYRVLCWTFVFASSASLFAEEAPTVQVSLTDTGQALINPQMGWTMHFYSNIPQHYGSRLEPSDTLEWFEGCSTVYLRVPWAFLEPKEGEFQWSMLDTPAQRWIAAGKKVAFRFTTSENWMEYATPKWVFDAGAKFHRYTWGQGLTPNGHCVDPIFDDPIFLEKLQNFLRAAGKRYNGNPNIAFLDIGTFGMWGEGHATLGLWGEAYLRSNIYQTPEQILEIVKKHVNLHREAFPDLLLSLSDDVDGPENCSGKYPCMDYARSKGVTLRDDSILVQPPPKHWFHADMAEHFWRELPVILEHDHLGDSKNRNAWNLERLKKSVEDYHASYLSIHWWPQEEWEECQETIRQINQRLGYRLRLNRLEYPQTIRVGDPFEVHTEWSNVGVALCYPDGFWAMTLKDTKGGIVAVLTDETFHVRSLVVGAPEAAPVTKHTSTFQINAIAPPLPSGTYDVFISVGQRDGTPQIALPYPKHDGQRRYFVGKIDVRR